MTDLIPYEEPDNRSYDEQLKDALEKALEIQGTVISDLEAAINCILQMERGLRLACIPNPHEATANYLKQKYKMGRQKASRHNKAAHRLLERGTGELAKGKPELVQSIDDWCDDCHMRLKDCACP